jgi:protein TonB
VQVVKLDASQFVAPKEIPEEIPPPMEDIPEISSVVQTGGGGILGGVPGGVVGNVLSAIPTTAPPPPPPPKKKDPIRVGGNVQSSKLITRVEPSYPELAKRARIQGIVLLQVTVDELGNVSEVKVIRGHPLLNDGAVGAVSQWKYSPTLLNGEPVPVIATVTVNFILN